MWPCCSSGGAGAAGVAVAALLSRASMMRGESCVVVCCGGKRGVGSQVSTCAMEALQCGHHGRRAAVRAPCLRGTQGGFWWVVHSSVACRVHFSVSPIRFLRTRSPTPPGNRPPTKGRGAHQHEHAGNMCVASMPVVAQGTQAATVWWRRKARCRIQIVSKQATRRRKWVVRTSEVRRW